MPTDQRLIRLLHTEASNALGVLPLWTLRKDNYYPAFSLLISNNFLTLILVHNYIN